MKTQTIILLLVLSFLAGCAAPLIPLVGGADLLPTLLAARGSLAGGTTLVRGATEKLTLQSTPAGATAMLSTGQACTTPCDITIERKNKVTVTFSRPSCDEQVVTVVPTLTRSGALVGGAMDYESGAVYSLEPNPVMVALRCVEEAPRVPATPDRSPSLEEQQHQQNDLPENETLTPQASERNRTER